MKKNLLPLLVILFSFLGANAFASKIDILVKRVTNETSDQTGSQNGDGSGIGGRNSTTRGK